MFKILMLGLLLPWNYLPGYKPVKPLHLKGIVVDAGTGLPVDKAYLYIVKGEEETLSNNKGEFTLTSWQQVPLQVTVIHRDFKRKEIKVLSAQPLKLALEKR
jgi:hypothetical protein